MTRILRFVVQLMILNIHCADCTTPTSDSRECTWDLIVVDTIKALDGDHSPVDIYVDSPRITDVSNIVKSLNILGFSFVDELDNFFAYSYSLRLSLNCGTKKLMYIASQHKHSGVDPFVKICTSSLQEDISTACSEYQGAYFHDCKNGECEIYWMFPLLLEQPILHVQVSAEGSGVPMKTGNFVLKIVGFQDLLNKGYPAKTALSSANKRLMNYVPMQCITQIAGPFGPDNIFLLSRDSFDTIKAIKYEQMIHKEWKEVCDCINPNDILESASLPGQLLVVSKHGVVSFYKNNTQRLILNRCIKMMRLINFSSKIFSVMFGACKDAGSVFVGHREINLASAFQFTILYDGTKIGSDPCSSKLFANKAGISCLVIDVLVVDTSPIRYYALLSLNMTGQHHYAVSSNQGYSWDSSVVFSDVVPVALDLKFPVKIRNDLNYQELELNFKTEKLVLTGFKVAPYMSHHIYLWGSLILHSPDLGKNFYILPKKFQGSVKLIDIGIQGYITLVSEMNEIWVSQIGSPILKKIYPTPTSDSFLQLMELKLPPQKATILTTFYDLNKCLRVIFHETQTGIKVFQLPILELLYNSVEEDPRNMWTYLSSCIMSLLECILLKFPWSGEIQPLFLSKFLRRGMPLEIVSHATLGTRAIDSPPLSTGKITTISDACPFSEISFALPVSQLNLRYLNFKYYSSKLTLDDSFNKKTFLVYHAILQKKNSLFNSWKSVQAKPNLTKILSQHHVEHEPEFGMYLYQNKLLEHGEIYVTLHDFYQTTDNLISNVDVTLPRFIYLNYGQTFDFSCVIKIKSSGEDLIDDVVMEAISLFVSVSDVESVMFKMKKTIQSINSTVVFQIQLFDTKSKLGELQPPGVNLTSVTVDFTVREGPLNCFRDFGGSIIQEGYYQTNVLIGCPPSQHVVFDEKGSLENVFTRDGYYPFDCLYSNSNMFCFNALDSFYPQFLHKDLATNVTSIYNDTYTLRIVGLMSDQNSATILFSEQQILAYNNLQSEHHLSLAWIPKYEQDTALNNTEVINGWPVYSYRNKGIEWVCMAWSPCAGVLPSFPGTPELYLLLEFTNALVPSNGTRCNFTTRFWIHVHGFFLDPIKQMLPCFLICLGILSTVLLVYYCCHRKQMTVYIYFRNKWFPHLHQRWKKTN